MFTVIAKSFKLQPAIRLLHTQSFLHKASDEATWEMIKVCAFYLLINILEFFKVI